MKPIFQTLASLLSRFTFKGSQKKIYIRVASFALVLTSLVSIPAFATIMVCFPYTGNCYIFDGGCEDWYGGGICFLIGTGIKFNPHSDYILERNSQAWIIQETKKIPIASDNRNSLLARINDKYADLDLNEPKIKKQIESEYAYVLRKPDRSAVSERLLSDLSKETGLVIR